MFNLLSPQNYLFNPHAIALYIVGLFILAEGIFAYFKNKKLLTLSFFFICLSVAIWLLATAMGYMSKDVKVATLWFKLDNFGVMFISVSILFFTKTVLGIKGYKSVFIGYLIAFILGIIALQTNWLVTGVKEYFWGFFPTWGLLSIPVLILFFGYMATSFFILFYQYWKGDLTLLKKNQIKYIIIAYLIGYIGSVDFLPTFDIEIYPFGYVAILLYLSIIAFTIIRYRLMDVYIVLRKTVVYGVLTGFMVGIVALVTFAGQQYFAKIFAGHQWVLSLISIFIITTTFRPLQIVLQKFVERFLFHQRYEYRDALKAADKELGKVKSLHSLLVMTAKVISDTLAPDHTALFIKNRKKNEFEIKISKGKRKIKSEEIKSNNGLIHWLIRHKEPVVYEELKYRLESEDWTHRKDEKKRMEQAIDEMERLNANVCIPSFYKNKLAGGVILGNRTSGNMYTQEDLDLLQSLANHTAAVVDDLQVQKEKDDLTVDVIAALVKTTEAKDSYTKGHSERVTQYAEEIARKLKNSAPFRTVYELEEKVHYASLIHDVGKVGIPDSILCKPSKLTDEEWRIMREHPSKGAEIISQIRDLDKDIIAGVLHHHERWDGRGYPKGLAGQDIPKIARILAVADAYDAMTTSRSYRKALTIEEAKEELRKNSGIQFDPQVVEAFLKNESS
ncbi:MAG: hypothetical protein B5M48_01445 [Candidatus Omnitrophica bacterium 4484_213]|nr:MAG: hypothetical protein B5M48_01445 [Candidatus Omnitrophica bacterium 4484_213]